MADRQQAEVAPQHDSHGGSVAAWTAVSIIALGALIATIAVVVNVAALGVIGAVVIVLGAITGKVLSAMGFGVSGKPGQ